MNEKLEEAKEILHEIRMETKAHGSVGMVNKLSEFKYMFEKIIEQAEQNKKHNSRLNEVRDYLQEIKAVDENVKYWGMNVIDVLLSVSKENDERNKRYKKLIGSIFMQRHSLEVGAISSLVFIQYMESISQDLYDVVNEEVYTDE